MWKSIFAGILLLVTMGVADARQHTDGSHLNTSRGVASSPGFNFWLPVPKPKVQPKRTHKHIQHRVPLRHKTIPVLPHESGDLATVPTAAGISITVEKKLVPQFQGFVADLVKLGYTPKQIHCWAPVGTHVPNSNHYHGGACDFDQTGWGRTATPMYRVAALTTKWGLRDGCSFRRPDCGHIDDGTNIGWKHPDSLIARYVTYQNTPVQRPRLEPFEE